MQETERQEAALSDPKPGLTLIVAKRLLPLFLTGSSRSM
jgi:hypothetical protein